MTQKYRYFLESNFVEVKPLFALVYLNRNDIKRDNAFRYYIPGGINKNYNVITNGKNFSNQLIDSHIKQYKEIRKLRTGQGEGYAAGCL